MTSENRRIWDDRGVDLGKIMLLLVISGNGPATKDSRINYTQGNHSSYPENVEKMARLLLSQYAYKKNNNLNNNPCNKRVTRTERRVTMLNQKIRVIII